MLGLVVVAMGCGGDHTKLKTRVDSFCGQLRSDVDQALTQYQQYADAVRGGSASVTPESEAVLAVESIGTSPLVRRARLRDLKERFQFCVMTRRFDEHRGEELQGRSEALATSLNAPAALQDAAKTVQLLQQYAALVHELDGAPSVD